MDSSKPAKIDFIDLKAQYKRIKAAVDARMQNVLNHGGYIMGPEIKELEDRLGAFVGSQCVGVSDGTTALQIALMAVGIKPGDEVITTPFTFIATGEMIALLGAKPVFVDIDPISYNIDPARIEAAITPRTRVIMPVSLYGQCADFDAINAIAARHQLVVIEDAAQSFGAGYKGRRSCNLSTIATTSFFPSKPLGCYGDGGACFSNDADLVKRMREIRVHGQDRRYHHPVIGLNGRLDTLQAAVLLAKMDVFEDECAARTRIADWYRDALEGIEGVTPPTVLPGNTSVYAQFTVRVPQRARVAAELEKAGVPTAVHYPIPLHLQPAFSSLGLGRGAFPVAERAADEVMSLPMHPYMDRALVARIAGALAQAVSSVREPVSAG